MNINDVTVNIKAGYTRLKSCIHLDIIRVSIYAANITNIRAKSNLKKYWNKFSALTQSTINSDAGTLITPVPNMKILFNAFLVMFRILSANSQTVTTRIKTMPNIMNAGTSKEKLSDASLSKRHKYSTELLAGILPRG
jgi:hypothetical protein